MTVVTFRKRDRADEWEGRLPSSSRASLYCLVFPTWVHVHVHNPFYETRKARCILEF